MFSLVSLHLSLIKHLMKCPVIKSSDLAEDENELVFMMSPSMVAFMCRGKTSMRRIMQSTCYLHFNQCDKGKVGDVSVSVTNSNSLFSSFEEENSLGQLSSINSLRQIWFILLYMGIN